MHVSIVIMRQDEIEMLSEGYGDQLQRDVNFFDARIGGFTSER